MIDFDAVLKQAREQGREQGKKETLAQADRWIAEARAVVAAEKQVLIDELAAQIAVLDTQLRAYAEAEPGQLAALERLTGERDAARAELAELGTSSKPLKVKAK